MVHGQGHMGNAVALQLTEQKLQDGHLAPERDECFGDQARAALSDLLAAGPLQLDIQDERDQYGRLLAYAYAGGTFVNLSLVAAGFTPGEADRLRRSMAAWRRKGGLEKFEDRLIEGMVLAGYAVGASRGYLYVRAEYPLAVERVKIALAQAYDAGLLGKNISSSCLASPTTGTLSNKSNFRKTSIARDSCPFPPSTISKSGRNANDSSGLEPGVD